MILTMLVTIHELGHFIVAKLFKVKVEEFGIGFPPRLWGRKKGETIYSVNAIPAGGFVKLLGEDATEMQIDKGLGGPDKSRYFQAKPPWVRSSIIVAGVIMNLLLAFVLFTALLASNNFRADVPLGIPSSGQTLDLNFPFGEQENKILILFAQPETPAEKAGLKSLDEVTSANGQTFSNIDDFQDFIQGQAGNEISFEVYNILDRESRTVVATPRVDPPEDEGALGIFLDTAATIRYQSLPEKIFVGPIHSVNMIYYQANAIGILISQSFKEGTAQPVAENVRGPLGIVAIVSSFIGATGTRGIYALVETVALLSLILAVINILPIPALDGGRLFFSVFEGVTRIKVNPNFERWVNTIGFFVLLLFFILITYNDIINIFR